MSYMHREARPVGAHRVKPLSAGSANRNAPHTHAPQPPSGPRRASATPRTPSQRPLSPSQRARSPSYRARLAETLRREKIKDLVYTKLQTNGVVKRGEAYQRGGVLDRHVQTEVQHMMKEGSLNKWADQVGTSMNSSGTRGRSPMRRTMSARGARSNHRIMLATPRGGACAANKEAETALDRAADSISSALRRPATAREPRASSVTPGGNSGGNSGSQSGMAMSSLGRSTQAALPRVQMMNKEVPLSVIIRDKIMQRRGGATDMMRWLRDDRPGVAMLGRTSFGQLQKVLRSQLGVHLQSSALRSLLMGMDCMDDNSTVNYFDFMQKVLPSDYPDPGVCFTSSIPQRARAPGERDPEDPFNPAFVQRKGRTARTGADTTDPRRQRDVIKTTEHLEQVLREKIHERAQDGPTGHIRKFRAFDKGDKGYLTTHEIAHACELFHVKVLPSVLQRLPQLYAHEKSADVVDTNAFMGAVLAGINDTHAKRNTGRPLKVLQQVFAAKHKHLRTVFRELDADHSGTISTAELTAACAKLNLPLGVDDIREMALTFDKDGDGQIDFDEFAKAMEDRSMQAYREGQKPENKAKGMPELASIAGYALPWADEEERRPMAAPPAFSRTDRINVIGQQPDTEADDFDGRDASANESRPREPANGASCAKKPAKKEREYVTHSGKQRVEYVTTTDRRGRRVQQTVVNGVPINISQMIYEKMMQRSHGGPHQMRRLFKAMDKDGSWSLSHEEFGNFLESMHLHMDEDVIKAMIREFDSDGDGEIDFNEFCTKLLPPDFPSRSAHDVQSGQGSTLGINSLAAAHHGRHIREPRCPPQNRLDIGALRSKLMSRTRGTRDFRNAFKHFDENGDGMIDRQEFQHVLRNFNIMLTPKAFEQAFTSFDTANSGSINYHDFCQHVLGEKVFKHQGCWIQKNAKTEPNYGDPAVSGTWKYGKRMRIWKPAVNTLTLDL